MRFTTREDGQVWVNPSRIDSMKETVDADGRKVVRLRVYGDTFIACESFDELASLLDAERRNGGRPPHDQDKH